jgi:lipoate-protein ligase B
LNRDRTIGHLPLGRRTYGETLDLQRKLHAKRCAGEIGDVILSVEHNPVFTIGRRGSRDSLLVSEDEARAQGIQIFDVERGGDMTYHGPGQLVVYPILDLRGFGKDVHRFVRSLEEALLRVLKELGIEAALRNGYPGVWVGGRKIASIGVYVKHWVSYHGLSLNVSVNPDHFRMIRPCGLPVETVSVNDLCEPTVDFLDLQARLIRELGVLWGRDVVAIEREAVD